jgi:hypothetical protein
MNPESAICHLPSDISKSRGASDALRFFSWLQAELDVQAFALHRDRLNAKRLRLDRESAANKAAARLMTGVVNVESEVTKL